jgi:hypothetical protein
MDRYTQFPDKAIQDNGQVSRAFMALGIATFHQACRHVHQMPYGYNSDRDDLMILFKEKMGTCTTKHAVIATLAQELDLPVTKRVGIYAMTEALVTGTTAILDRYRLPYVPMLHCFLEHAPVRVDLTEGNRNGKNGPIDDFLFTERVAPNVSEKEEYLIYRKALTETILKRRELEGVDLRPILQAREEGLKLLKANQRSSVGGTRAGSDR